MFSSRTKGSKKAMRPALRSDEALGMCIRPSYRAAGETPRTLYVCRHEEAEGEVRRRFDRKSRRSCALLPTLP
jgi:hypothetical protein